MPVQPGSAFGPYHVVAPIGTGGMGEVYRAHDPRLNRDVALKFLRPEFSQDPERLQRFVREAHTLASLNHPHIAQIYGVEDVHGTRALVMEFVDGEDLAARLKRGPLAVEDAIEIAQQIAAALEAAHEQNIVHRDLKPANIKVRLDGSVKVLDLGLAKALAPADTSPAANLSNSPTITSPVMTAANVILGTAAYMSPEQARGKAVDKRTDVWAFGAVLFEMLTGRAAFRGETTTDLLSAVVSRDPDWDALPNKLPPSIRRLLRRCLEKDVRVRLRDIGEARIALAQPAAEGAPSTASRRSVTSRARTIVPWAVAVIALAVAAAVWVIKPTPASPLRKIEIALHPDALATTVAIAPDGTAIAYRVGTGVFLKRLDRLQSVELSTSPVPQRTTLFWSPDAAFIVYSDGDGKLWAAPTAGGPPRLLCAIPETGQLIGGVWGPSGRIVIAVWRGGLYQVPTSGGQPQLLLAPTPKKEIDFHNPVALPDGRLIVATHLLADTGPFPLALEIVGGDRRERILEGDFLAAAYTDGYLLVQRGDMNQGVWAIRYSGSGPIRIEDGILVAPGAGFPTVATDGTMLYPFESAADQSGELVWIDRSGRVISTIGAELQEPQYPVLSPDDKRIAFSARAGTLKIFVRDSQTLADTRITSAGVDQIQPTWFPTGQRLMYFELRSVGFRQMVSSRSDGSGDLKELVNGVFGEISPDGRYLVYGIDERGASPLRFASLTPAGDVGAATPLFKGTPEPNIKDIEFSPDGRYLAFTQPAPGGSFDLFVTTFPDGAGRWLVAGGGARSPVWASNGELFFIAAAGASASGQRSMMSASFLPGTPPRIGTPVKLFDLTADMELEPQRQTFDVTSDGKRIVMIRSRRTAANPSATRWILVQNWRSELTGAPSR